MSIKSTGCATYILLNVDCISNESGKKNIGVGKGNKRIRRWFFWVFIVVFVQLFSCIWLLVTPWTAARQASLSFAISQSLLRLMSAEWCHSNILFSVVPFTSCLLSFTASGSFPMSQLFASSRQYWSFSFSSPSNEYSGLISFRIEWFDLAVQRTLKSLLQHHNLNA